MSTPELVKTAIEAAAAAKAAPIWFLDIFLTTAFALEVVPRFMRGSLRRHLCVLTVWLLVCLGICHGVHLLEEGFKRTAAPFGPVVCSALDFPKAAVLTYWTAADAVELTAGGIEPIPGRTAGRSTWPPRAVTLPMGLVRDIDQARSGQPLDSAPPAPTSLELRLRPALEAAYVSPVRRFFWFALAAAAAFCVFVLRLFEQGIGRKTLPYLAILSLSFVLQPLRSRKLDVEYRASAVCEPVAAALAKAYADPAAVTFTERRGLDGRSLTVRAVVPRTFLGHAGDMTVVADLPAPLLRRLDAAASVLGFAPLNSNPAAK